MGLDIRLPLGLLFLALGVLMAVFGVVTHGSAIYARSLGVNLNLAWGVVLLAFGAMMFLFSRRGASRRLRMGSAAERPSQSGLGR